MNVFRAYLLLGFVFFLFVSCEDSSSGITDDEQNGQNTATAVVDVTNPATGRVWMDRNLGASRAATSMTDEQAYGDLYQWGRDADGHQNRNSSTTTTLSNSDQPGNGRFISASDSPYDWRRPQNNNLWQGVNGINNPCPSGYRLPTETEWEEEIDSWISADSAGAFASSLKLPLAGVRFFNGDLLGGGSYWSGTADGTDSQALYFWGDDNDAFMDNGVRAFGYSVRCLKD